MAGLKRATSAIRFRNECKRVAVKTGYEVGFYPDKHTTIFQDDGVLHIAKFGIRACFVIAHDDLNVQNERIREVLGALRLSVRMDGG